jgi:hypothetical protein
LIVAAVWLSAARAHAQSADASQEEQIPSRPIVLFNRWEEDWSVLADPRVPREPFDELKYIALSPTDPLVYLSLGADYRSRFEANDAPAFGTGPNRDEDYVITRTEVDADLHLGPQIQIFTQLQNDWANWKTMLTPVDQDRLDLEQAFILISEPVDDGTLRLRLGRQQFAFDLQRFVSVRDGPNVRQSYDAVWTDYQYGPWKYIAFATHPVVTRDVTPFDDYSSRDLTFSGARVERALAGGSLSGYYAYFTQANVHFLDASGNERRNILDVHLAGAVNGFDYDVETMGQIGQLGPKDVRAWAFGSLGGYTWRDIHWTPRAGLQLDAASGDNDPNGHILGTFNPLFPNGYYLQQAAYTGYVNLIHLKPSVSLHPQKDLTLLFAVGSQWRQTTDDAVYVMPDIPIAGTAGNGGRYTGTYGQVRLDWVINGHAAFAVEVDHFDVSDLIERVGGHDSTYAGVEIKLGW